VHTTHISGAAVSLNASPAPSANSSLANFLLAGTSGNAGQDFRTIAAALFGLADSTADQTDSPAKGATVSKESAAGGIVDESKARKDKKTLDPVSTLHPELTVPVVVPEATVQAPPKQDGLKLEGEGNGRVLQTAITPSDGANELAGRMQIERDEIAATLSMNDRPQASPAVAEESSTKDLPRLNQPDATATTPKDADLMKGTSVAESILQRTRKPGVEIATPLNAGTSNKKATDPAKVANDRPQQPSLAGPVKHESTPAPTIKIPTSSPDTTVGTPKSEPTHSPAAAVAPVVTSPAQTSNAHAKEIAESEMSEKAGLQSKTLSPALATESRQAADHIAASALSKIKERNNGNDKDRINKERVSNDRGKDRISNDHAKDVRAGSNDGGKLVSAQTGRAVAVTTNLGGGSKDDMGSPHNPAAQAKAGLAKASAGTGASATAIPDMDGPDEALPANVSSPLSAKFIQGMSGSEFRVGMQSQEFGSIDIRTSVARHMFSAQISVEHGDVAKSLATELPALYSKLADQHVPVANIVIQGQSLASSSGFAQDAQQQQGWRPQQGHGSASSNTEAILPVAVEALDTQGRLDIRI
jgi:flagellar hook-length control protein FliK